MHSCWNSNVTSSTSSLPGPEFGVQGGLGPGGSLLLTLGTLLACLVRGIGVSQGVGFGIWGPRVGLRDAFSLELQLGVWDQPPAWCRGFGSGFWVQGMGWGVRGRVVSSDAFSRVQHMLLVWCGGSVPGVRVQHELRACCGGWGAQVG